MIATLAVPAALVLTLADAGYHPGLAIIAGLCLAIATGVLNGVLVAYAEIPALFTHPGRRHRVGRDWSERDV